MYAKNDFVSDAEMRAYVDRCEADFEAQLNAACDAVCAVEGLKLIGLSGPTCSGKTTTANKLIANLSRHGRTVHIVSIDDFYYDRNVLNERAEATGQEIDYDSIDTIDFEALREVVREIFTDESTVVPRYDFKTGKRSGYIEYEYDDNDLFIFEGIQAIYPEIVELFKPYCYRSIYICAESPIELNGQIFEPTEIRFMRRMVRDYNFRAASPEFTYFLWESVRANEDLHIYPYAHTADIRINSTMPYELNMLTPYLIPLLNQIKPNSEYYAAARALLARIDAANIMPIPSAYMAGNSLYHEFLQ
ncbi:MAG: hypothetical protein IKD37_02040 [Clostridia bacterium]|nr:hypothetical protein [Clostridia bacterium]